MILRKQKARDFQLRNSSFLISPLSLIIFQQVVDRSTNPMSILTWRLPLR